MAAKRRRSENDLSEQQAQSAWHFDDVAVLGVGTPNYAKDLVFSLEVGIAYCDGRPTASWLVEPEERWEPSAPPSDQMERGGVGDGLRASLVAEELRAATRGFRVFSQRHESVNAWLGRLAAACGIDLGFRVCEFRSLLGQLPSGRSRNLGEGLEWAERWAYLSVPETRRSVVEAARDVALLREIRRMSGRS